MTHEHLGPGYPEEPLGRLANGQPYYAGDSSQLVGPRPGVDAMDAARNLHDRDQLAVSADNVALAAEAMRKAQRDYLYDRGNDAKGRAVAMTAGALDRQLAIYWAIRKRG